MTNPNHQFIDLTHFGKIHFVKSGNGPLKVVLLHGWGMTWKTWERFTDLIDPGLCTFYNLDMIGFGDSDKPEIQYTVREMAQVLLEFTHHEEINDPVLCAHSMGVTVSLDAMLNLGLNPIGFIISDSGARSAGSTEMILDKLRNSKDMKPVLSEILRHFFYNVSENELEMFAEESMKSNVQSLIRSLEAISQFDFRLQLHSIDIPTLILYGEYDQNRKLEEMQELEDKIPDSELTVIKEAAHCPMFEKPEVFTLRVEEWIKLKFRSIGPSP